MDVDVSAGIRAAGSSRGDWGMEGMTREGLEGMDPTEPAAARAGEEELRCCCLESMGMSSANKKNLRHSCFCKFRWDSFFF